MPGTTNKFTARFPAADQATLFHENVDRVIATTGTSTLDGNDVNFTAESHDSLGYSTLPDIKLSVSYYGGQGTTLSINDGTPNRVGGNY